MRSSDRETEIEVQESRQREATPAQLAPAWLLRRSPVMLPIPGTASVAHLEENVAAAGFQLADEQFEALAKVA
jgi:pyridoxine 4-dehydrogenase